MKIIKFFLLIYILFIQSVVLADNNFNEWVLDFKKKAQSEGISSKTVNSIMDKAVFLPKVIQYDRYQPEFYEDTKTYIDKRVTKSKIKDGISLYNKKNLIIAFPNETDEWHVKTIKEIWINFGKIIAEYAHIKKLSNKNNKKIYIPDNMHSRNFFNEENKNMVGKISSVLIKFSSLFLAELR